MTVEERIERLEREICLARPSYDDYYIKGLAKQIAAGNRAALKEHNAAARKTMKETRQ